VRWVCGVAREDRIRNELITNIVVGVALIEEDKVRLRWFGQITISNPIVKSIVLEN